jgi:hypothetical protein
MNGFRDSWENFQSEESIQSLPQLTEDIVADMKNSPFRPERGRNGKRYSGPKVVKMPPRCKIGTSPPIQVCYLKGLLSCFFMIW